MQSSFRELFNWFNLQTESDQDYSEINQDFSIESLTSSLRLVLEKHHVITSDGYILEIHRLPGHGPAVFLQHGLLCTSSSWLISGRFSLAYILHRAGYDVWLGNLRGNQYGLKHVTLDPERDLEFWEFTFHHHGTYDLPAIISKIKDVTCNRELFYIGHSMGSTSLLVMASQRNTFIEDISLAIMLAPVLSGSNMTSSLKLLAPMVSQLSPKVFSYLGMYVFPFRFPGLSIIEFIRDNHPLMPTFVQWIFSALGECKTGMLGREEILRHLPSTTSTYVLLHFSQNITDNKFSAYDWKNREKNIEMYSKPGVPEYSVSKLTCPTAIFYSEEDKLSSSSDVLYLESLLPNLVFKRKVCLSHLDYIFSGPSKFLVSSKIDKLIQQYTSS